MPILACPRMHITKHVYQMSFFTIVFTRNCDWTFNITVSIYIEHTILVAITSHFLGLLVLYLSRSVVNIVGCPFSISVDSLENLSAFDKTICGVTNFQRPNHVGQDSVFRRDVEKGDEMTAWRNCWLALLLKMNEKRQRPLLNRHSVMLEIPFVISSLNSI